MKIVPVDRIPKKDDVIDAPVDDLMKLYKTCKEMEELCTAERGVGLSAVQVGIPWRLFVIDRTLLQHHVNRARSVSKKAHKYDYLVNCEYESATEGKIDSVEGCLSLKAEDGDLRNFKLERFEKVKITGQKLLVMENPILTSFNETLGGFSGVVYQHEIDHHRGILISDIGEETHVW